MLLVDEDGLLAEKLAGDSWVEYPAVEQFDGIGDGDDEDDEWKLVVAADKNMSDGSQESEQAVEKNPDLVDFKQPSLGIVDSIPHQVVKNWAAAYRHQNAKWSEDPHPI